MKNKIRAASIATIVFAGFLGFILFLEDNILRFPIDWNIACFTSGVLFHSTYKAALD